MMSRLIVGMARFISGANPRWIGCKPDLRQRVYFANHTSNFDAVVLWALLPPGVRARTRPVAARDYWMAGAVRRYLAENVFHAILIERKRVTAHNHPIDQLLEALGGTDSIIIFPEGGRNPGPEVGAFKSGIYHLAKKRPDIEMVPVHIDNMNRILPKGEVLPVPLLSCVSFGAPMRLEPGENKQTFLTRAQVAVSDLKRP
jgi:1-acyl-sn-glycerol-3-phosphate acyltransferase